MEKLHKKVVRVNDYYRVDFGSDDCLESDRLSFETWREKELNNLGERQKKGTKIAPWSTWRR